MQMLGMSLSVVGLIVSGIGGIWFLVAAFRESVLWALGCLFAPFVSLLFLILHWREAAKPFGVSLLGTALMLVAIFLMPDTGH